MGWADTAAGVQDAYLRTGSTMSDIAKLLTGATSSVANDGVVVGSGEAPGGEFGSLYQSGKITYLAQRTMDCCHTFGGSLNKNLQIIPAPPLIPFGRRWLPAVRIGWSRRAAAVVFPTGWE